MCGRYTLTSNLNDLQGRFGFEAGDLVQPPRYNIAPSQSVLAVVNQGRLQAEFMRWGLIPYWAKDASIGARMINARAETVAERPAFREALQRRRCLILADGFYEWRREGDRKTPVYVALKSREPFGMAGLWEVWKAPSGELVRSCAIVTTTPNRLMTPIHSRMPVILARGCEATWLDRNVEAFGLLAKLLVPYPAEEMDAYQVSALVNSQKNDIPECLIPVAALG